MEGEGVDCPEVGNTLLKAEIEKADVPEF